MRKIILRMLVVAVIVTAAYNLNEKLKSFPTSIDSNDIPATVRLDNNQTAAEGSIIEKSVEKMSADGDSSDSSLDKYQELVLDTVEAFKSRSEKFTLSYTGDKQELSEKMSDVIRASLKHDDYVAYILDSYSYTIRTWGNRSTIAIETKYRESIEQTGIVDQKVVEVLNQIVKQDMNDHEKVKVIHDWIVTNVEYDQSLTNYTAYEAVTLGKAVCQGYALLAYKMLQEAGITVLIAEGAVDTGEHAWNMVRLDGQWYHLDPTWDDPVGATGSSINYNYYLKTDEELAVDHQWTRSYPKADMRYVDFIHERELTGSENEAASFSRLKIALGLHWLESEYTVASEEQLNNVIKSAVSTRTNQLQFRYVDGKQFPESLKTAFEALKVSVGYKVSYEVYSNFDNSLLVNLQIDY